MNLTTKIFKNKDLRSRIMFLMMCLMIYKIGMHITVPWINVDLLKGISSGQGALSLMNSLNGGAFANFSIFAVGIMPYITASITISLLQMNVVPILTEWRDQGEVGRQKLKKLTFVATLIIAIIQSLGMSFGFNKMYPGLVQNETLGVYLLIALVLTLGTVVLVVMGELIDKRGIGKGISMIILAGILMSLPNNLAMYYDMEFAGIEDTIFLSIVKTILLALFVCLLLVAIIIINGGERRVPIQNSSGVKSSRGSFLPFKINSSGVIPVIFASALIMIPTTIANTSKFSDFSLFINKYISYTSVSGMILYALIIVVMTYFYTFMQVDPKGLAKSLHENGSHVPSIRPGKETEEYFSKLLVRLTLVSSVFLAAVAIAPMLLGAVVNIPQELMFGGTSIIIIVSVVVDLKSQVNAALQSDGYDNIGKLSGRRMF